MSDVVGAALAIAALAAIESLLSARVAATMSPTGPYDPDRELVGQGLASVASGVFGGMPATGAIARTAVNVRSGARTRVAAIVHSLVLLACGVSGDRTRVGDSAVRVGRRADGDLVPDDLGGARSGRSCPPPDPTR